MVATRASLRPGRRRRLEHASVDRSASCTVWRWDIHQIDARFGEGARDRYGVVAGDTAFGPIGRGVRTDIGLCAARPPAMPRTLQWKAQAIGKRTTVASVRLLVSNK
jgi:hypothetical protein